MVKVKSRLTVTSQGRPDWAEVSDNRLSLSLSLSLGSIFQPPLSDADEGYCVANTGREFN